MPTPSELFEHDIAQGREVYHLFQNKGPQGRVTDNQDWVLLKHNADRATCRGSRRKCVLRANELLDDPGVGGTGALMVVQWTAKPISSGAGYIYRINDVKVGEHMGAGRMSVREDKFTPPRQ